MSNHRALRSTLSLLYGLKQAPRAWYSRIDTYLQQLEFRKNEADSNLYYIVVDGELLILVLYVDDLFITGELNLIQVCKRDLASEFAMKDTGLMHYFLGLEVWQEEGHIFLGQGKYAVDVLSRFHMGDCKPMSTPMATTGKELYALDSQVVDPTLYRQLIESLMYMVNTRVEFRLYYQIYVSLNFIMHLLNIIQIIHKQYNQI